MIVLYNTVPAEVERRILDLREAGALALEIARQIVTEWPESNVGYPEVSRVLDRHGLL